MERQLTCENGCNTHVHADIWSEPAKAEHRLVAMKTLMHVADISNAGRPPWFAGMWTRAIYEEFYKQGDAEKEMGLDVSPLCDRETVAIAESQVRVVGDGVGAGGAGGVLCFV